jgi:hypothetical protein
MAPARMQYWRVWATAALGIVSPWVPGCSGDIGPEGELTVFAGNAPGTAPQSMGPGAGSAEPATTPQAMSPDSCSTPGIAPGPSPLRRLTRFEYNNTVHDLLQDASAPANAFPLEEAGAERVPLLLAEGYLAAAEKLAGNVLADLPRRLACATAAAAGDMAAQEACAQQLVDQLGPKAYRRPLTTDERERLVATFRAGRAFLDFESSIGAVLESMLLSPQFLYRVESGTAVDGNPSVLRVDAWGMASRLSYFMWASMPDDALLAAAEEGRLATAADVRREAERMYGSDRSRAVVRYFNRLWLELSGVDEQHKDPDTYPDYTDDIGPLLRIQTETFAENLYFTPGGTLNELFTAPYTYMNQQLARFFGVSGPTGDTFEKVDLDPAKHAGVLTEASLMSHFATADRTHPILRGVFVRRHVLCDELPDPPAGITDGRATVVDPNATERERLSAHRTNPSCANCHQFIDPVGLAFENFDATGRWRDLEAGKPVDASGNLDNTDVAGPVNGAIELSHKLAQSEQVRECLALHWFRFASGRGPTADDACSMARLNQTFTQSGGDLRELVLAMTQTDAFLYRSAAEAEVAP